MSDLRASGATRIRRGTSLSGIRVITLLVLDSLMLSLAWIIAEKWGTRVEFFDLFVSSGEQPGSLLPILAINLGIIAASGLYGTDDKRRDYLSLCKAISLAQIVLLMIAYLYQPGVIVSRSTLLTGWILALIFVSIERLLVQLGLIQLRIRGKARQPIFLLGKEGDIEEAIKLLNKTRQYEIRGQAVLPLDDKRKSWIETIEYARKLKVDEVFVCSWEAVRAPIYLYWELKAAGIALRVLPIGLKLPSQWSEIKMIEGVATIRYGYPPILGSDFWVKRVVDIVAASIIFLMIFPVFLVIALLIKLDSPGPIFFKQTRIGLKGRRFKVWKFRTMVINAEKLLKDLESKNEMQGGVMFKMKHDPRVTKIGNFLRRYSLDELPQIINVLVGEMSLVGPRPFPLRDVEKMSDNHFIRHEILPGITGLWQVSGRSNVVNFDEVFRLDLIYIQNWSLALDFQIMLQTIKVVLRHEGAF